MKLSEPGFICHAGLEPDGIVLMSIITELNEEHSLVRKNSLKNSYRVKEGR